METQKSSLPGSEVPVACATERVCDCELLALPWAGQNNSLYTRRDASIMHWLIIDTEQSVNY